MAALDWGILILFLFGLIGIVIWVVKRGKDNTSHFPVGHTALGRKS